jgi:VanZ family protein
LILDVLKRRSFLKYWLPVLLWMGLIFSASSDTQSFARSSRILAPLLHWLFPHLPEDTANFIVLIARKGAHLTEYAVLAVLLWRALRKPAKNEARPWNWRETRLVLLSVALYAARDTSGGAAGLLALWLFGRWRKYW